jgi:hypothetical protein
LELQDLPPHVVSDLHSAFATSLDMVFIDLLPLAVLTLIGTALLKELRRRTEVGIASAVTRKEQRR